MTKEKNNVVRNNKVILNLIQDLQRWLLPLLNNMRGRCQIKFGMTPLYNTPHPAFGHPLPQGARSTTYGFTLIELLVVVLIIGILAAVALPQYQKAVIKSRVASILPLLSTIVKAQNAYYTANGQYPDNANQMDITPQCLEVANTEGKWWQCGNDFLINIEPAGWVGASYCPGYNMSYEDCKPKRYFQIAFGAAHSTSNRAIPNSKRCWRNDEAEAKWESICKVLGTPMACGNQDNATCYDLY